MVIQDVKKILDKEQFETEFLDPSASTERLHVLLGLDSKKRERMLEIFGSQQQMNPDFIIEKSEELPYILQFRTVLPFKVQDMSLSQVASLLLFLNQMGDLPGFELNELEGRVVYRYTWLTVPALIQSNLVMHIMGAIMLNLALFADTIEEVAQGKISFNDLLQQISNLVKKKNNIEN